MKTTSTELKKRAKLTLSGNYGTAVGAMLIVYVLLIVVIMIFIGISAVSTLSWIGESGFNRGGWIRSLAIEMVIYFIAILLVYLIMVGIRRMFYHMCTGQPYSLGDMLFAFTHRPQRFLGVYFINLVFGMIIGIPYFVVSVSARITGYIPILAALQFLMYLLQIVGIVVYSLHFKMAVYLLMEDPERTVISCFRESAALMKGNKGRLFYLGISLIGMYLLGFGSFGIGFLWILPYIETTMIHFYLDMSDGPRREEAYDYEEPVYDGRSCDGLYGNVPE